jgi:hypothetical protein
MPPTIFIQPKISSTALTLQLANLIALMSCGSSVNCALFLLRCMRCGVERTGIRYEPLVS